MCCRFSYVTSNFSNIAPPSSYVGNTLFNKQSKGRGWNVPTGAFADRLIDPPFVVAVVRKILEDDSKLDQVAYCLNQSNCA